MFNEILVIDGSSVLRKQITSAAEDKFSFNVMTAGSYNETREKLEEMIVDVKAAVTGIVLPDAMDGEIIDLLNEYEIPTVVLTSHSDKILEETNEDNIISKVSKQEKNSIEQALKIIDQYIAS